MKLHFVLLAAVLLSACNRAQQNTEAVRQGVVKYLASKPGLSEMQVDVSSVTFRDSEADAVVAVRPKGSNDPASGMTMRYTLERKGGDWVVKPRSGANPHGGGMPKGMPPAAGAGEGAAQMPPGHPPAPAAPPAQK